MERTTIEQHAYITGRELKNMRFLGLALALAGILAMLSALQSPAYADYGIWGWLATLGGSIMIWGEAHEAILEGKSTKIDHYLLWILGIGIVIGLPWSLVALI